MKKILKWLLLTFLAVVVIAVTLVSVALSPKVLTRIANKAVAGFVDGTATVGRAEVRILRTFPAFLFMAILPYTAVALVVWPLGKE